MQPNDIQAVIAKTQASITELAADLKAKLEDNAALTQELAQRVVKLGDGSPANAAPRRSVLASATAQSIAENIQNFEANGKFRGTVNAAATDLIGTADVGVTVNTGLGSPNQQTLIGFQHATAAFEQMGASSIEYSRFIATEGGAAVQSAEGDTKAAVRGEWVLINQPSITIAGTTTLARQALNDNAQLQAAVQRVLRDSIARRLDAVLVGGSGALFAGFETLAPTYVSAFDNLPDAIIEGIAEMQKVGSNPSAVALNPATWAKIATTRSSGDGQYLAGSFLGQAAPVIHGLPVVMSLAALEDVAVLVDREAVNTVITAPLTYELGYVNDGFARNLITLLAETRIAPQLLNVNGLLAVSATV